MGLLVKGTWHDRWYDTKSSRGKFVRQPSRFRGRITADGHDYLVATLSNGNSTQAKGISLVEAAARAAVAVFA